MNTADTATLIGALSTFVVALAGLVAVLRNKAQSVANGQTLAKVHETLTNIVVPSVVPNDKSDVPRVPGNGT